MQILFFVLMFVLGAVFGSFLCCQVRRLKIKEGKKKVKNPRSICLHCGAQLKWYDNIPILSWLFLRGECRICHKKIGVVELVSEVLSALAFVLLADTINIYTASALEWIIFVFMITLVLIMIFIAIYDGLYGEIPALALTFSIICAIIIVTLRVGNSFPINDFFSNINSRNFQEILSSQSLKIAYDSILSATLYGGVYLVLYLISKGKWVGDGDWLLAVSIGLALGSPVLSLSSLFLANFLACLISLPLMKNSRLHEIYFAPYMVAAFIVIYISADNIYAIINI